ncbi:MAG: hypothetical protein IJJ64_07915 [Butyrivibrio sp.]|nr:hypothetical protein [Butyrivibrio sp.]
MNGFKLMADSYRKAAEEGKIDKEQADKDIRIFDFLATCDEDDFCKLFDSSAFNEIAKSYMRLAVRELVEEEVIDEDQGKAVRNRFSLLFDEKKASEVI